MSVVETPPVEKTPSPQGPTVDNPRQTEYQPRPVALGGEVPARFPLHERGTRSRRHSALIAFATPIAVLVIASAAIASSRLTPTSRSTNLPASSRSSGSVVSVQTSGSGVLNIRATAGNIVRVHMVGKRLVTKDGKALDLASVQPKDAIAVQSSTVVDASQVQTELRGIVATSPGPDSDVLTVQLSPTRTVVVELGPQTRINGSAPSVDGRMSLLDSQSVRVVGTLNTTLDSVTQTRTIDVVQP